jgi:hypothetical protein
MSFHNVRYLRYVCPKIAHPDLSGLLDFRISQALISNILIQTLGFMDRL